MSRGNKIFLYLIYFAIVAALSGIIITSAKSKSAAPKPSPATTQKAAKIPGSTPKKTTPAKPASPKTATLPSSVASTGSSSAAALATNPAPLANTGPGNVAGLFVVTTVGGAVLYRRYAILRL